MRIGVYNTYFESPGLGGGERYMLSAAAHWSNVHDVTLVTDQAGLLAAAEKQFGLNLGKVRLQTNFFKSQFISKLRSSREFDVLFMLTDGSVPYSLARHNILHVQVPFAKFTLNPLKFATIRTVVCNSEFTRTHMDQRLFNKSQVIYPPVDTKAFVSGKKEKLILSVGRFSGVYQAKKQEVLISSFQKLNLAGWKLVLAGGLMDSDGAYYAKLQSLAERAAIELKPNTDFTELVSLYSRASVYWHAAGFGESDPTKMEHFGICPVEAMAAGCVPLVYNGGGLSEVVVSGESGYLWDNPEQLIALTRQVLEGDASRLTVAAQARAKLFDQEIFFQKIDKLVKNS